MAHAGVRGSPHPLPTHGQNVSGGDPLENLLDHHLDRRKGYVSTKPAFLDDPDLQLPDDASDSFLVLTQGSPGRSNDTGSSRPSSTGSEPPEAPPEQSRGQDAVNRDAEDLYDRQMNPKGYQDLHPESCTTAEQAALSNAADNCQGQPTFCNQSTYWTI